MCDSCHVVSVQVSIKDMAAFSAACHKLGYSLAVGPHKWYGRWADDSPVPRHLFATTKQYEDVLAMTKEDRISAMNLKLRNTHYNVTVPDHDYQIGLVPTKNGYQLAWDNWHGNLDLSPLAKEYTIQATLNEAHKHAHTVTQHNNQDGSTVLRIEVPA